LGKGHLPNEFAAEPEERLLEVVIRFGRNLEVLEVLLPVESHLGGLDFPLLKI
jgi:hypothetical protein